VSMRSNSTPMLLNVVQKQQAQLAEQKASTQRQLAEQETSMQRQIAELNEQERAKRTAIEERLSKLEQTNVAQHGGGKVQAAYYR
jgi:hypothetical protein